MSHINQTALADFLQNDEELLGDLAIMFVRALPDCEARLRYATVHRDASVLQDTAHQLKSQLGYFSADGLQKQAFQLEGRGKASQWNGTDVLVEKLLTGIQEMLSELRELTCLSLESASDM